MTSRAQPPPKDRRDIGQVVFLMKKMNAARELSSCCVGVEAALEGNVALDKATKTLSQRRVLGR